MAVECRRLEECETVVASKALRLASSHLPRGLGQIGLVGDEQHGRLWAAVGAHLLQPLGEAEERVAVGHVVDEHSALRFRVELARYEAVRIAAGLVPRLGPYDAWVCLDSSEERTKKLKTEKWMRLCEKSHTWWRIRGRWSWAHQGWISCCRSGRRGSTCRLPNHPRLRLFHNRTKHKHLDLYLTGKPTREREWSVTFVREVELGGSDSRCCCGYTWRRHYVIVLCLKLVACLPCLLAFVVFCFYFVQLHSLSIYIQEKINNNKQLIEARGAHMVTNCMFSCCCCCCL